MAKKAAKKEEVVEEPKEEPKEELKEEPKEEAKELPTRMLVAAGGKEWYVDADGNKIEE